MQYTMLYLGALMLMTSGTVSADADWVPVGGESLGIPTFVDAGSRRTNSKGHVRVLVLTNHKVTQTGIDRFAENGEMFRDTRFKHRSSIEDIVLDCENRLDVSVSTRYHAGPMGTGEVVLFEEEVNPEWTDILFLIDEKLTKYVCNM